LKAENSISRAGLFRKEDVGQTVMNRLLTKESGLAVTTVRVKALGRELAVAEVAEEELKESMKKMKASTRDANG